MGQPVAGNPTQFMMERAFEAGDLDWRYLTLEVSPANLEAAIAGMRAMGFRGGNFTIPHKVEVLKYLDGLSQAAELMGAVNCVYLDGDRLLGENTDGKGFLESLREISDPAGKRIVILGAGGAARAVSVELGLAKPESITIANRSPERGGALAELLSTRVGIKSEWVGLDADLKLPEATDIIINATSIGLGEPDARVPLDVSTLKPNMIVADVVFNPPVTRLLADAQAAGCTILNGLGMLVNQGVIGFKIWTGVDPDRAVMREALEEYLEI